MTSRYFVALMALTLSVVMQGPLFAQGSLQPIAEEDLNMVQVPREAAAGVLLILLDAAAPPPACDEYLLIWGEDRSGRASADAVALACDEFEGLRLLGEFSRKNSEVESALLPPEMLLVLAANAIDGESPRLPADKLVALLAGQLGLINPGPDSKPTELPTHEELQLTCDGDYILIWWTNDDGSKGWDAICCKDLEGGC